MEEEDVSPDVGLGAVSDRALPNVDPVLAIKMKELDLLIKQEERETLLVKLHLIEVETDQAFRLQQLKYQDLKDRPVPKTRSRPPSVSSLAAALRASMSLVQIRVLMLVQISNLFHPSERVRQMPISSHLNA